jgi:hypothetical protein
LDKEEHKIFDAGVRIFPESVENIGRVRRDSLKTRQDANTGSHDDIFIVNDYEKIFSKNAEIHLFIS